MFLFFIIGLGGFIISILTRSDLFSLKATIGIQIFTVCMGMLMMNQFAIKSKQNLLDRAFTGAIIAVPVAMIILALMIPFNVFLFVCPMVMGMFWGVMLGVWIFSEPTPEDASA